MTKPLFALIITNFLLLIAVQATQVFIVPVYAAMFADFGAKLPSVTQLLIDWTDYCKHSRWGGDPLRGVFALTVAICYIKGVALHKCLRLALVFHLLLLLAMSASLFLPVI